MSWIEKDNALHKRFEFQDFKEAMSWMNKAAHVIDKMDHHPEWSNVYNTVQVKLTTHDAGNQITEKDRKLAEALDNIK